MATKEAPDRAEFISEIEVFRRVEWGGFQAELAFSPNAAELHGTILLSALAWVGQQPRLALTRGDKGHRDWAKLLEAAPVARYTLRFVGHKDAAPNSIDQWLTHGPSDLLARS